MIDVTPPIVIIIAVYGVCSVVGMTFNGLVVLAMLTTRFRPPLVEVLIGKAGFQEAANALLRADGYG